MQAELVIMDNDEVWDLCKPIFILALILGIGVYATHQPPEVTRQKSSPKVRQVASVDKVLEAVANKADSKFSAQVINMNCLKTLTKPVRLNTEDPQIRIIGKECTEKFQLSQIKIENSTNGFEASLFKKNGNRFSTDYLSLNKGTNSLKVTWNEGEKKTVLAELLVQRSY